MAESIFGARDLEARPIERAETIPSTWYTTAEADRMDRLLLERTWQYAGHVDDLPEVGSHLTLDVLDEPVLVVRNKSGIQAFYNVCRHRGGPLATGNGKGRVLRCHYHAWTYDLEGRLIGTPRFEGVQDFDPSCHGLEKIRTDVSDGMVFVDLSGEASPLKEYFGGIGERIAPIDIAAMKHTKRVEYDIPCNWKVYVDNFLEGYHILPVHPELAKVLDVSSYTTRHEGYQILQHGPFSQGENPYHAPGGEAFYYFIYPNIMLNVVPGRCQTNLVLPLAPDRCRVIFDFFHSPREEAELEKIVADDFAFSDLVQQQDIDICKLVQRRLGSRSYERGRYSVSEESGVHRFHALLRQSYRELLAFGPESV